MTKIVLIVSGLAMVLGMSACEKEAPPPPPSMPAGQTPAQAAPGGMPAGMPTTPPGANPHAGMDIAMGQNVSAMGFGFKLPEGWKQAPPSNTMRLAEAIVPDASGDPGKACTLTFSTAGGDTQMNIDRWVGQVTDATGQPAKADIQKRVVAGLPLTVAEMTGTYSGMGDQQPRANWTMRGAIYETPQGLLFVKMFGPADAMKATSPAFNAMLDAMTKQ